jgi:Macrocin-O-methyltransferase (TylF)
MKHNGHDALTGLETNCYVFLRMSNPTNINELYIGLMKRCLSGLIYPGMTGKIWPRTFPARMLLGMLWPDVRCHKLMTQDEIERGLGWPIQAQTMIGQKRLNNLQFCVEDVIKNKIPGDFIETGVWRGGSVIFMKALLKVWGVTDRTVWVADSFEGLPKPNAKKYPADAGDLQYFVKELKVSLEQVKANFAAYDLLDDQVRFLKGWFKDTLPGAPISSLAIARLDGDLYESTMDALTALYPKLSVGGYLIVDDYSLPMCEKAVQDYRNKHGISEAIQDIDGQGRFWQRVR